MKYSRWAQNNLRPGTNNDAPDQKEIVEMDDSARAKAIQGLLNKAETNKSDTADAEKQRADAVAVLAGKEPQKQELRPGVKQLLNGGK